MRSADDFEVNVHGVLEHHETLIVQIRRSLLKSIGQTLVQ